MWTCTVPNYDASVNVGCLALDKKSETAENRQLGRTLIQRARCTNCRISSARRLESHPAQSASCCGITGNRMVEKSGMELPNDLDEAAYREEME